MAEHVAIKDFAPTVLFTSYALTQANSGNLIGAAIDETELWGLQRALYAEPRDVPDGVVLRDAAVDVAPSKARLAERYYPADALGQRRPEAQNRAQLDGRNIVDVPVHNWSKLSGVEEAVGTALQARFRRQNNERGLFNGAMGLITVGLSALSGYFTYRQTGDPEAFTTIAGGGAVLGTAHGIAFGAIRPIIANRRLAAFRRSVISNISLLRTTHIKGDDHGRN